ncbi:WXG100 family type VII secretion target [Rhodococcoides fascians]|uniref:WXG100 family type VII secretion target n=1 Tax=Rhodococcoides fascians TaxID=1828 RepID=UPI0035301E76
MRRRFQIAIELDALMVYADNPDAVVASTQAIAHAVDTLTSIAHELREILVRMSTDAEGIVGESWSGAAANDYLSKLMAVRNHGGVVSDRLKILIEGLGASSTGYESTDSANAGSIQILKLN